MTASQTLTAFENGGVTPEERPIMTHCQVLSPSIIARMKAIGAVANVQPSFVPTDMRQVEFAWFYFYEILTVNIAGGCKNASLQLRSSTPIAGKRSCRLCCGGYAFYYSV